jgi:acyl-CoA synthetase (AMP-forming)/AMP-acid ligase II
VTVAPAWELRHPPSALAARYRAAGWWTDDTLSALVAAGIADAAAARCRCRSRVRPFDGTVGEVADAGRRLAGALSRRGVGPGDVVAVQLPNWAEAIASIYGVLLLGAVLVPVLHIYGSKEIRHVLRQSGARALVTAGHFGRHDYLADLEEVMPALGDLELVVVVPTDDRPLPSLRPTVVGWSELVGAAEPLSEAARVDPDSPAVVGYTSGTTAAPKGVVHTHRTFLADQRSWADFLAQDRSPPPAILPSAYLTAAPLGHVTGLSAALRPLFSATPLDLLDTWDPGTVLDAMARDRVAVGGGAPFFLTSLLEHPAFDPAAHLPYLARLTMGGAPVPTRTVERAIGLGISITRSYGSTEHPSTTGALHSDPLEKKSFTDGRVLSGSEVRLLDPEGRPVPAGRPGEIYSRGPELFAGYVDPARTPEAIDHDGWYDTGDVGILDADGYLTITDRTKDVIIRGGENVSAAEVEELIGGMPGVAEVAVVAAPDARYGEHGAALVRLLPDGRDLDLEALRGHLRAAGLARQKWPEELRVVEDFPRTASGKVQKHVLRSGLRAGGPLPFERRCDDGAGDTWAID